MGATLVALALTRWAAHVPDRAFRVLIRMAITALDEPKDGTPAKLYFAGADLLLTVMPAERGGNRDSRLRSVRRAIDELVAMGAIRRTNKAYAGVNQVYQLTLMDAVGTIKKKPRRSRSIDEAPVDNPAKGDTQHPAKGDTDDPAQQGAGCPERGTPTTLPRNQEEPREELREDTWVDLRSPVTVRAHETEQAESDHEKGCGYPGCVRGFVVTGDPGGGMAYCPQCNSNVIQFPTRRSA